MAPTEFSAASLGGTYAVVVNGEGGRGPYAALGLLAFDGAGRAVGSLTESRPGPRFAERAIATHPYSASYTVAADGTGTLTGDGADDIEALVAVRAIVEGEAVRGAVVASEIAILFRELDPVSGCLRAATGRRLPDGASFAEASLGGRYTGFGVGRGGQVTLAGLGVLAYDGAGGFSETNTANGQGDTIRTRRFVAGADRGRYVVNADGTGSVADGGVLFVITKAAKRDDGPALAEEYAFMLRDLVPGNGAFFTGIVRRIAE